MSKNSENIIDKKIEDLKYELKEINNGIKCIEDLQSLVSNICKSAIDSANNSDSIDNKISVLVNGMQSLLVGVNNYLTTTKRKVEDGELKISTLQNIKSDLDVPLVESDHEKKIDI